MNARDEDLADRVADLEEALRGVQSDLRQERNDFPRVPTPTDLLKFTDEYGIPAAIAFLEAHIRALELLQGMIRLTGVTSTPTASEPAVERVSRTAVRRLDALVDDLKSSPLPSEPESRSVLEEAQSLRDELAESIDTAESPVEEVNRDIGIDVDDELSAIKSDVDDEDPDDHSSGENR